MARFEPATVVGKPCPPLTKYSAEEQKRADAELANMEKVFQPCVTCGMIDDFGLMRDQCRP